MRGPRSSPQRNHLAAALLACSPHVVTPQEKTPPNSLCVPDIDRVRPHARYVHVGRDPRDVMASLRDVAGAWAYWGPYSADEAAQIWLDHCRGARQAVAPAPERYVEIRYEELRVDPKRTLPDDPGVLVEDAESRETDSFDSVFAFRPDLAARLRELPGTEPAGFRSAGRRPLGPAAARSAELVLGRTAREAGYTDGWPTVSAPVRQAAAVAARRQTVRCRVRRVLRRRRIRTS